MPLTTPAFIASGTVLPGRAVKITGESKAAQSGSNEMSIGISRMSTDYAPLDGIISTNNHAVAGEPLHIIGNGEVGKAVAGGSFSAGARLKAGTGGKLVAVAGSGGAEHVVATALQDGALDVIVDVYVNCHQIWNT